MTARKVAAKKVVTKKSATQRAVAAKGPVIDSKTGAQKVSTAGKKVVTKEARTMLLKKRVARKLTAERAPAVNAAKAGVEAA